MAPEWRGGACCRPARRPTRCRRRRPAPPRPRPTQRANAPVASKFRGPTAGAEERPPAGGPSLKQPRTPGSVESTEPAGRRSARLFALRQDPGVMQRFGRSRRGRDGPHSPMLPAHAGSVIRGAGRPPSRPTCSSSSPSTFPVRRDLLAPGATWPAGWVGCGGRRHGAVGGPSRFVRPLHACRRSGDLSCATGTRRARSCSKRRYG